MAKGFSLKKTIFYNGNPNIKADRIDQEYTKHEVEEYIKCASDINYFIETYCKVMTLDDGFTRISLRDYQKRMFGFFDDHRWIVCNTGRQIGKSITTALYVLHRVLFHADQQWFILANKLETAREIFGRLVDTLESIPFFLQCGVKKLNESTVELSNGSKVTASATSKSAIRGRTASGVVIDEAGFVNGDDEFFTSVFPVISSGKDSKIILISTPNGMNNTFYRTYRDAKEGRGDFKLIEVDISEVPGRDEEWKQKMIETIGERKFNQEFLATFMSSEGSLIPLDIMERIQLRTPLSQTDHMKIYDAPKANHQYVIIADVARGVGIDSSAFSVMDCTSLPYKQVAVYTNNEISPLLYPHAIHEASKWYNNAWIMVEINDAGGQVADILHHDLENEYVLWCGSSGRKGQVVGSSINAKPGVRTTTPVKAIGCSQLRTLFDSSMIEIYDQTTFTELTSFVSKGGSYAAENGAHDDCVMTLVLFAWLTDQAFFKELFNQDTRKRIVEDKLKQLEDDMLPLGFFCDGRSDTYYDSTDVIDYTENPAHRDEFTDWMTG